MSVRQIEPSIKLRLQAFQMTKRISKLSSPLLNEQNLEARISVSVESWNATGSRHGNVCGRAGTRMDYVPEMLPFHQGIHLAGGPTTYVLLSILSRAQVYKKIKLFKQYTKTTF